jgi:orotate phosphoribosyltransferase
LEELVKEGANVLGMVSTFSYEFPATDKLFRLNNCKLYTLSTFSILKKVALEKGYISQKEFQMLEEWQKAVKFL